MEKKYENFVAWLGKNGLKKRAARDVVYRCKRIERIFEVRLEKVLTTSKKEKALELRLLERSPCISKSSSRKIVAIGMLYTAIRHFREYLSLESE